MNGKWIINSSDTYSTWGVVVLKGSYNSILSPPKPRQRLEYSYNDRDGVNVDTISPLSYEEYRYTIKIAIVAKSYTDYWTKYNAFFATIATADSFSLKIVDLGVTVNLLYEGAVNIDKRIRLRTDRIVSVFEMSVFEKNPKDRNYE